MHDNLLKQLTHEHDFDKANAENEKKTLNVIALTSITMVIEIVAGALTGSMALLADGWHMATHAFALGITYFAFVMARKFSNSDKFSFGTGKFGILSAYTSALFLGCTAIYMMVESLSRFINPIDIAFNEAIIVSIIGLTVNVLSIWMLHGKDGDHHEHEHGHGHGHDHENHHGHKHDHNLRAAYLHVVADALTSVLAIIALISGKYLGWSFLDPVMGIVGGVLIAKWAWGLLRSSSLILLDGSEDKELNSAIVTAIESDGDSVVADLHIWPLSSTSLAATIIVISKQQRPSLEYSDRLSHLEKIKHITIETHICTDELCCNTSD